MVERNKRTVPLNPCFRYAGYANEILMQIRSTKKIQSEVSLQDPIGIDREGNEITPSWYMFLRLARHSIWFCNIR